MAAAIDALKVFATVEKAALRWKGHRGPQTLPASEASSLDEDEALKKRQLAFLLREQRAEQRAQELLEKRQFAAAQVRKALRDHAKELVISRPLRRFGMKLSVQLVFHRYDAKAKREDVTRHMVVMEDSIKWDDLDTWVRLCLGLPQKGVGKDKKPEPSLAYQYVSLNGHATVINGKGSTQAWLDSLWAVPPRASHSAARTPTILGALFAHCCSCTV